MVEVEAEGSSQGEKALLKWKLRRLSKTVVPLVLTEPFSKSPVERQGVSSQWSVTLHDALWITNMAFTYISCIFIATWRGSSD